ncbi:MAG: heavy metal translocating P-type ATPase, partial [Thermoflexales bacterium]|nr:heavy metal translocating P-type ATPase [Thermoflexales bacterium]
GIFGFVRFLLRRRETALAALGAVLITPALALEALAELTQLEVFSLVSAALALGALVCAGSPIARNAWRALRVNREIGINALVTLAAIGAVSIGAHNEAGLLVVLFALGKALEEYTAARAHDALRSLAALIPSDVLVLRPCVDCKDHLGWDGYSGGPCPFCGLEPQRVPAEQVSVGERVLIRPGDRIALDGVVCEGCTQVDQSALTGESLPIVKRVGDPVFAGSVNGLSAITVEVTRPASESTLARIVRLVEQAQESRAPVQQLVERFARYYTPAVVAAAVLIAVVPPAVFGAPFWNTPAGEQGWLYRALELLVVACPCALVISTPVALVSSLARAAQRGVLIKRSATLEMLSQVRAVALDKTGTLTEGQPRVTQVRAVDCIHPDGWCERCDDLLALAGAVEQQSAHPFARAIQQVKPHRRYPNATEVTTLVGQGVQGVVEGRRVIVGSHALFDMAIPHPEEWCIALNRLAQAGQTPLMVGVDGRFAGYIAVADLPRESSRRTLQALKQLGVSRLVMLTGDSEGVARHVAAQVGVEEVRAGLLPADKLAHLQALRAEYQPVCGRVAMIGDGINDAPALAAADVSIAMGGAGNAQAMDAADVVLMKDDLSQLPFVFALSKAAMRTIRANVAISVGVRLAFFALVLAGFGSLWLAVVTDMGTSLLVTLNGLRLLRFGRDR